MKKEYVNLITYHNYINSDYILEYLKNTNTICVIIGINKLELYDNVNNTKKFFCFHNRFRLNFLLIKILFQMKKKFLINNLFIHEIGCIIFGIFSFYLFNIKKINYMGTDFFFYKKNFKFNKNIIKYILEYKIIKISSKVLHYSKKNYQLRSIIYNLNNKKNYIFPLLISSRNSSVNQTKNSFCYFGSLRKEIDTKFLKEILIGIKTYNKKIFFNKYGSSNSSIDNGFKNFCIKNKLNDKFVKLNTSFDLEEIRNKIQTNNIAIYFISTKYYLNYSYNFLPSKILEYLHCNIPIICNFQTGITARYVKKYNLGKVIKNSTDHFFQAFEDIRENREYYSNNIKNFINTKRDILSLEDVFIK